MAEITKSKDYLQTQFNEILVAIHNARSKAYQSLNKELITLYWQIGEYISRKVEAKLWGK